MNELYSICQHCTPLYSIHYTLYIVHHFTVYIIKYSLYSVLFSHWAPCTLCILYSITLCSVLLHFSPWPIYDVYTTHCILYTLYTKQYTLYSVHIYTSYTHSFVYIVPIHLAWYLIFLHTHGCIYICVYVCVGVFSLLLSPHLYTYVCVYLPTHTHTYTHGSIPSILIHIHTYNHTLVCGGKYLLSMCYMCV